MKTSIKILISGGIVAGGTGIPFLTYDQLVGKKIRKENKKFEQVFKDRKELIKSAQIEGLDTEEDPAVAAPKIRKGCEEQLNDPSIRKTWNFLELCENKFSTVREFLSTGDNKDFITQDDDYEIAAFFFKGRDFSDAKKSTKEKINGNFLKSGCEENLKKEAFFDPLLIEINRFCKIQKINTVEKIIKSIYKDGTKSTSDGEEIFETGKSTDTFISLLQKHNSNKNLSKDTEKTEGGQKLKEGCEASLVKKLTSSTEIQFLDHVNFACSGETPEDMEKSKSFRESNERGS